MQKTICKNIEFENFICTIVNSLHKILFNSIISGALLI